MSKFIILHRPGGEPIAVNSDFIILVRQAFVDATPKPDAANTRVFLREEVFEVVETFSQVYAILNQETP